MELLAASVVFFQLIELEDEPTRPTKHFRYCPMFRIVGAVDTLLDGSDDTDSSSGRK